MAEKPTYEEMKQRVDTLEKELAEQKLAEKSRLESEALLKAIMDNAPALMSAKDLQGNVILTNRRFEVLDGPTPEEFVGKNVYDLFPFEVADALWKNDLASIEADAPVESEEIVVHKDKAMHIYHTVKFPLYGMEGKAFGTCAISVDITERRKAEEALQKAHDELETRVEERTAELRALNEELYQEIKERKQIEAALKESEERLKSFYNAAFEGIVISEQGKIIDFNRQFTELLGYKRDELIGREIMDLVAEEDRELVLGNVRSGFNQPYEHKALRKDGAILQIEVHGQQIQFQGRPARVTAIHDLSERKRTEDALRESEERYRSLFRNNHSVMLLIDPASADIVDANPAAISYYGWSHEALTCKKIADINTLTEEQVFQEMERANKEQRRQFYFQHRLANGDIRDVEVYSGPIKLGGKQFLYSIIHDITERKKAEEEGKKLIKELQEALKEIKTLRGILPLCSFCKKIRDDKGYWEQVDVYIHKYSQADISHSICPECMKEHYPDFNRKK